MASVDGFSLSFYFVCCAESPENFNEWNVRNSDCVKLTERELPKKIQLKHVDFTDNIAEISRS